MPHSIPPYLLKTTFSLGVTIFEVLYLSVIMEGPGGPGTLLCTLNLKIGLIILINELS